MNKYLLAVLIVLIVNAMDVWTACPLEDDPINLTRCIQVDVTALIYAARGKDDITSLCALADRYMECIKTYTRGCVGFYFGEGSLTELQNIAMYCCKGVEASVDCPFNPKVTRKCFAGDTYATMSDGSHKPMKTLEVGDKVKTLDSKGNLIDTDVVMIMDKSPEKSNFLSITTYSNKTISVSATHLMPTPDGSFKYAKLLFRDDDIITYDYEKSAQVIDKIKSVLIEPIEGYIAPLTMEGTILVNDVLASCYAVVDSHTIAHTAMAPARWWYAINQQFSDLIDMSVSTKNLNNGTHWYPEMLYSITDQFLSSMIKIN